MKFQIWWFEDDFNSAGIISKDQYEININIIQVVVDSWKQRGIRIMHGCFDNLYQLQFIDWDVNNKSLYNKYLANKLLFDIERAMREFKIK